MKHSRSLFLSGLCLAAGVGATCPASAADAPISFRKAYSGSSGGNSYFGAGYTLEYGLSTTKTGANARVGADAKSTAWVKLFNQRFDAVSMKATLTGAVSTTAPTCSSSITHETYLVGIKLPNGTLPGGNYARKNIALRSQRLTPKATIDLVNVGVARLGLEAYASATEYVQLAGTAWCNNISAEIRPGAKLSAVAAFRADALIVAAGIRGTLNLMDMSLPAKASMGWGWQRQVDLVEGGSYCSWSGGNASANSNFEIIPVSGKFEPYVRVGLECTNLWGILPGKGLCINKEWSHVLWEGAYGRSTFPLANFSTGPRVIEGTAACPPAPASPPNR